MIGLVGKLLGAAANVLLGTMVIVTCIDVVGRYFFSTPLIGAHELITLSMGIMIYLGLPLVTVTREHLTVDLANNYLGSAGRRFQQVMVNTVGALTLILFSYLLILHGVGLSEDLMTFQDFEIEQAPFSFLMALMCLFTALVFLKHVFLNIEGKNTGDAPESFKKKWGPKFLSEADPEIPESEHPGA